MSKVPADHLEYLNRRPFALRCSAAVFPADELQTLRDYGNWLEALATGVIQPVTAEQKHFLKVEQGAAEPRTDCERAWVRLRGRREYELEQQIAPPHSPPEDYGMIEWDAERCWW